ncbi:MAG: hypothetical protein ACHQ7M_16370 [Chloroflexota bacterium]
MPDEPAALAVEAPPAPEIPDLDPDTIAAVLSRYQDDPEKRAALVGKLRTHPLVSNIAGDMAERQRQQREQESAKQAVEGERARLRKLAEDDPLAFSQEMATRFDKDESDRRTADLRATTRQEYIQRIGTALRDIPEAMNLTAAEHGQLAQALAGVAEDDVIPVFQRFMTDFIAEKRATKKSEAAIAERLKAERKAWDKEQADKRLKSRTSPSTGTPPTATANDTGEPDWRKEPAAWEAWYDAKRKAGTLVRSR